VMFSEVSNDNHHGMYESVYFYTFHKCASSLFSGYVLANVEGLKHVDYASVIFNGAPDVKVTFKDRGGIYGPIRISANPDSPVYARLVKPATTDEFIRDKTAIFMIRDPRDILVSLYYSFGFTHRMSQVKKIAIMQQKIRDEIQSQSIDDYVLLNAKKTLCDFEVMERLVLHCRKSVIIRYEDMVMNWPLFEKGLTTFVNLRPEVLRRIYQQSRSKEEISPSSHRRSGKVGSFENELRSDTVVSLNAVLEPILHKFEYTF